MARFCTTILLLFAVVTTAVAEIDAVSAELRRCADISDATARLSCFDALAATAVLPHSQQVATTVAPSNTSPNVPSGVDTGTSTVSKRVPAALPEDFGMATIPQSEAMPAKKIPIEFSAIVTRCEESETTRRLFFFLENGQVWRQQNKGRLRFENCAFEVTISKDRFGYRMQIPSEDRRLRVSRVR